ncbi:hypothetical protein RUM44_004102 [Polyplax serrata]|uniref:Uncharacterized protein n=1 Tax=Polyplax serrata TaxID=468196 RepID=A0ABR1B1X1_POLSC
MASTGIIPTYQRFVNGAPVPAAAKRSFRPREKCLILLVIVTFVIVCFGAFFDLPEYKSANAVNNVYMKVYEQLQNAPQLLIPPPPHSNDIHNDIGIVRHGDAVVLDPHKLEDRVKLLAKIEQDELNQRVLERPNLVKTNDDSVKNNNKFGLPPRLKPDNELENRATVDHTPKNHLPLVQGGEDGDPVTRERRNKIKQELPNILIISVKLQVTSQQTYGVKLEHFEKPNFL